MPARRIELNLYRTALCLGLVAAGLVGWVAPVGAAAPVTITAVAHAGVGDVFATATLAGGNDPTGAVTFRLFGPGDDSCTRSPLFTSTNPVTGAGATSDRFVLPGSGVYHFVASYGGDARNAAAGPTPCGDPHAAVGYGSSSYAFSARASGPAVVGGTVSDTATITTSSNPTGTMTFTLFGPSAASCRGVPVLTSVRSVAGSGAYASDSFVPVAPGTYRWVARYSGDADDPSAATACDDPAQRVEVTVTSSGSTPGDRCTVPAGSRAVLELRLAAFRRVLQALGNHPLAALLARAGDQLEQVLTACRPPTPPG